MQQPLSPPPQPHTRSRKRTRARARSFNLALAFGSSLSLFLISPAAAGSGIPDVKAYLNGVESPIFRNFFTVKTFVAKARARLAAVVTGCVYALGVILRLG